VLAANTFLPALLSVVGPRINKLMILRTKEKEVSGWHKFAAFVMKKPIMMAIAASAILIVGILPVGNMSLIIPEADALPKSYDSRVTFEKFEETFSDKDTVSVPIIASNNEIFTEPKQFEKLEKITNDLTEDP